MTLRFSIGLLALSTLLASAAYPQQRFQVVSTVAASEIAGRPVQLDARGKLLPWPFPDNIGYSYSSHVLSQWTILWDQFQRQKLPYFYCCFAIDRATGEVSPDRNWANSTAYLRAMLQGFVERLYPYTGDKRTLEFLEDFVDYEMENGFTPDGYVWSRVPYPSADPGVARYRGWSPHGEDYVEPHLIGEDGYAYVRLYEQTGKEKYLRAAIHFADELVRNYKPGDADHSPWPVRCFARDGRVEGKGMGPYSANVLGPISLFDELIRLKQGNVETYSRTRKAAWQWLEQYPLQNNVWVGYFEDVAPSMGNMNNVVPLETARYILLHPESDQNWQQHARQLIEWVRTTARWPKYVVHGATVTTEQGNGIEFCCNQPNQCCDSHTSRLAAVEALYYARTGDEHYREEAFRSFNWVTYFQGLPEKAHAPFSEQWWFTDEFTDGPRRLMDAFWAVPEWAPADESHLLGSTSVVTQITYQRNSVAYSTFDSQSEDVLLVAFKPTELKVGGRDLRRLPDWKWGGREEGYTFDQESGVLHVRHETSGKVLIHGEGGSEPTQEITFDDPHLRAGTTLQDEYPKGVAVWSPAAWRIIPPSGKFGTFSLGLTGGATPAAVELKEHRTLAGVDVYNPGDEQIPFEIHCGSAELKATLRAGEMKRLRTKFPSHCRRTEITIPPGLELRFDNLAYRP